jgi:ankyrin repeat protein
MDGSSALIFACQSARVEAFHLLLRHGADANIINFKGRNAFIWACRSNCMEMVQYLVNKTNDINLSDIEFGMTAFMYACKQSHIDIVKFLLFKFDSKLKSREGKTAFHYACQSNCEEIIKLLIFYGKYDANLLDHTGKTGFDYLHNCRKVVEDFHTNCSPWGRRRHLLQVLAENGYLSLVDVMTPLRYGQVLCDQYLVRLVFSYL